MSSSEESTPTRIERAATSIERNLSRSLPVLRVSQVEPRVIRRKIREFDSKDVCHKNGIYFRVITKPPSQMSVLDTRSEVTGHLRHQLDMMNKNSLAPETTLIATDFPKQFIEEPLAFFLQSEI